MVGSPQRPNNANYTKCNILLDDITNRPTMNNIPRMTRRRGVLALEKMVKVYDMRNASSSTISTVIVKATVASCIFETQSIGTGRLDKCEDSPGLSQLEVTLFDSQEHANVSMLIWIPSDWTPELYLATLQKSISESGVISLESVVCNGKE